VKNEFAAEGGEGKARLRRKFNAETRRKRRSGEWRVARKI
jgi:hypothetical protein